MARVRVCKFCGASDVEVSPRKVMCNRCHMVYDNTGTTGTENKRHRRKQQQQPKNDMPNYESMIPKTFQKYEEQKKDQPQYVRIHDVLRTVDEHGEEQIEIVQDIDFRVAAPKYVPDLHIDAAKAEFFRWLFADTAKKEKRYGREYLKRNGIVKVGEGIDRDKVVSVYAPMDDAERIGEMLEILDGDVEALAIVLLDE